MIAVVRCSSSHGLVAVSAWMLESIHDVYSYDKLVARSVVVLLACVPCARVLMRLLLSGTSALPAESACCYQRTAAFESLVSAGETLEGTRGKLRCLVLHAQASSEYIPIQLRTGLGWCYGCTLLRSGMPLGVRGGKERPERVATWLILPVVICLSQRLSHACLSINCLYCETANGSLNQL